MTTDELTQRVSALVQRAEALAQNLPAKFEAARAEAAIPEQVEQDLTRLEAAFDSVEQN